MKVERQRKRQRTIFVRRGSLDARSKRIGMVTTIAKLAVSHAYGRELSPDVLMASVRASVMEYTQYTIPSLRSGGGIWPGCLDAITISAVSDNLGGRTSFNN
jgi:hypothetical protein